MHSEAKSVDEYLQSLPDDRRQVVEEVRGVILANLPGGYEEAMNWGMICYQVPLEVYADTYNGRPLMYAGLASQKNYVSLYLNSVYADEGSAGAFRDAYEATGKKLDMGKSCVRFRSGDDVPLQLVGQTIRETSVAEFIALTDRAHSR